MKMYQGVHREIASLLYLIGLLLVFTQQQTFEVGPTPFSNLVTYPNENVFENTSGFEQTDQTVLSFTEEFLTWRAGRKINLTRLLMEYSLICPMQQTCGVNYDGWLLSEDMYEKSAFPDCMACTCERTCLEDGNCCPGSHFGYLHHECINTVIYPEDESSEVHAYMANECHTNYTFNSTLVELCKSIIRPCTSFESGFIYKNTFCAQCNGENECIPWKLNVECTHVNLFQGIFKSASEVKEMIDKYGCMVQYKHPNGTALVYGCDYRDYLSEVHIDRCNVTGLWDTYDADIEWACEHFVTPYNLFKNVFCYICNPSYAKEQTVTLIDDCNLRETGIATDLVLNEACRFLPVSERMWPFKNMYCYVCNEGQDMLQHSFDGIISLADISEYNDPKTLETQISASLVFQSERKQEELQRFVLDNMKRTFKYMKDNRRPPEIKKTFYNPSSLENIISDYVTVCGTKNLCSYTSNFINSTAEDFYGNPVCGDCNCNYSCVEHNYCCLDVIVAKKPYSCLKAEIFPSLRKYALENQEWIHEPFLGNTCYKIIDTCLENGHSLAHKCSSYKNTSDFLSIMPVGTDGHVVYRNIYCYSCNNNISDISLNIQALCKPYIEYKLFTEVTQLLQAVKLFCHQVAFVPEKSSQCEKYDPIEESYVGGRKYVRKEMHPSQFDFVSVEFKSVLARNLKDSIKIVYSKCNQTGYLEEQNDLMTDVCENEEVNMMSLLEYRFDNRVYKNFACFLCNPEFQVSDIDQNNVISACLSENSTEWYEPNETLDKMCLATPSNNRWYPFKSMYCSECNQPPWQQIDVIVMPYDVLSPNVYQYLFSMSPEDFERMDMATEEDAAPECFEGTFDFIVKKCRSLFCNEGYQLFNASCKPVLETVANQIYSITIPFITSHTEQMTQPRNESIENRPKIDLTDICLRFPQLITHLFDPTTEFFLRHSECKVSVVCDFSGNSTSGGLYFDITGTRVIEVSYVIHIKYTESVTKIRRLLLNALDQRFNITDLLDSKGNLLSIILQSGKPTDQIIPESKTKCLFSVGVDEKELKELHFPYTFYKVDKFLLCPFVKLNMTEAYIDTNSRSLVLNASGETFTESEYKTLENFFIICVEDYNREISKGRAAKPASDSNSVEDALNTFTLVCTIISLLCLCTTFTVYCLFSSLRTIPGKSVMLLCFAMFCAQSFLQFGLQGPSKSSVCVFIGVCIHYFWIAAFCAMQISSFHMFKVFYFNDLSNELNRNQRLLFIKYFLYFLFSPLALVFTAITLNSLTSGSFNAGYGDTYCFISDFYIFVGTFLTPACFVFLSNIVFFSLAFHKIRVSPNVRSNQEKRNFFIFIKLCTIVGVTWPLLLIDGAIGTTWFSFVVAGVNALQGVFIFVSFVLTRRVISLCSSVVRKESVPSTKMTSSGTKYKFTYSTKL